MDPEPTIPCTMLSDSVRVRLYGKDLQILMAAHVDIPAFIRRAVNIQVREFERWK